MSSNPDNTNRPEKNTDKRWPPLLYLIKATTVIVLTGAVLVAVYYARNILLLVIIAAIIAIGLEPIISGVMRILHISRVLTISIAILIALILIALFALFVVPPLVNQITELSQAIPGVLERLGQRDDWIGRVLSDNQKTIQDFIAGLPSRIIKSVGTIIGITGQIGKFIINILTVVVLTLFFINQIPGLAKRVSLLFEPPRRTVAIEIIDKMVVKIGSFVSGNLMTSAICTITTYIALLLLGVPYSIPLAMWVGFTDLIPQIGAFMGALPVVIIAFYHSFWTGVITVIFFIVYQQVENFLITPKVMQKAVNLTPSSVLIATLIGGALAGIVGILLALPVTAMIKVFLTDVWYPNTIGKEQDPSQSDAPAAKAGK
jgi:predicted PurR-regulated permease PerM